MFTKIQQVVLILGLLLLSAESQSSSGGSTWRSCQGSRICNTSYDEKIQAINFTLSNAVDPDDSTALHYKVLWNLSFKKTSASEWNHVKGLMFGLSYLDSGSNDTCAKNGICQSFGCKPGIAENRILLDETKDHSIEVTLTSPPTLRVRSLDTPPSVNFSEVNLTNCVPDISYTGVVQRLEFNPLLRINRDPDPFEGGRAGDRPQCTYDDAIVGTTCQFGSISGGNVPLSKVEFRVSVEELKQHYDKITFSLWEGGNFVKMYTLSIENADGQTIISSELRDCQNTTTLSQTAARIFVITFEADPNGRNSILRVSEEGNTDNSANFTCEPICGDDNSCLQTKKYTVVVKILLRDVIRDLKMITTEKQCPEDMKWVDGIGCQCNAPYSYFSKTSCVLCIPGKLCSPLELKTQNAFVPKAEDGMKFRAKEAGSWTVDPVASQAACQLDEVEAILSNDKAKEYKMTLKDSDGSEVCAITLKPKQNEVLLNSRNLRNSDTGSPENCGGNANVSYSYKTGDSTTGSLKISTPVPDKPLTCQFSEIDDGEPDQPIDTQYLHKKEIVLALVGTKVANHSEKNYRIMKDQFTCEVQGTMFASASITCGTQQDKTAGLKATCDGILRDGTADCTFNLSMNPLLNDIYFPIQRTNIAYHDCNPGSYLNKDEGVCNLCPVGKYSNSTTKKLEECDDCPDNEYTPHMGSTQCFTCELGIVNKNRDGCTHCAQGNVPKSRKCEPCPAGKYLHNKTKTCEPCSENKYSQQGSLECYQCPNGSEAKDDQTGCKPCNRGWFHNTKSGKCEVCPDGKTTELHGQTQCTLITADEKFCDEVTYRSLAVGDIVFTTAKAGHNRTGQCHHNKESSAVRLCNSDGTWGDPNINACDSAISGKIKEIDVENESAIESLENETENENELAPKDIELVCSKMTSEEVSKVFKGTTDRSIRGVATTSLGVLSNMMAASESSPTDQRIKNAIVQSFEHVAVLALNHMKTEDVNLQIQTDTARITLVQNAAETTESIGDSNIQINVDKSSNIQNLAMIVYNEKSTFKPPSDMIRENTFVAGKVVGLKSTNRTVESADDSISFKITFDFEDVKNPEKKPRQNVVKLCKYYETDTNTWSTDGCKTKSLEDGSVECECDHMTSFAVILSVQENKVPMWLSNLVLGLNVTFCLLTLLCTLPFRTFRVRKMTIIQSHSILSLFLLCVTWFLMQDMDLSETEPAYESTECKAVAFIAHYFLMATFSWIFCCSLTLKSQIVDAVKSFGKKNKNLVKKCVLFGYGFPLLIPSLAFLMDFLMKKYTRPGDEEQHYIRQVECWYEDIWVYSFILFPIYVFFVINIVCFIKIMRVIGNARRSNDGSSERRVVKAGFALAFTQGLPWIIHPGALTEGAAEVFQYLFLITFGLQGIGLFVFNVLFQEEVLKHLCGLLNVKPPLIFLSVVPSKQRRTPNSQTGETSLGTARHSSGNNDKCYSNNLTLNSVATVAVGDKSLYQDSSHYNELHESSLLTEHRVEDTYKSPIKTREKGGSTSNTDLLGPPPSSPRVVKFVAGTRTYGVPDGHRSPIPGETETLEHQGPPLM